MFYKDNLKWQRKKSAVGCPTRLSTRTSDICFSVLLQLILVRSQSELRHDQAESCRSGTTMGMRTRLPHGCSHPIKSSHTNAAHGDTPPAEHQRHQSASQTDTRLSDPRTYRQSSRTTSILFGAERRRLHDLFPVTSAATLLPVSFVRIAPDSDFRQHR